MQRKPVCWHVCQLLTTRRGTRYRSWLTTSLKIAGSIPDEVIGFFSWPNHSSRIIALGSIQPLTEMSTRNLPGDKGWPALKADNLIAICEPIVEKMWEPRCLTTQWASTARYSDSVTFFYLFVDWSPETDLAFSPFCLFLRMRSISQCWSWLLGEALFLMVRG
jgi:hypothetical protein